MIRCVRISVTVFIMLFIFFIVYSDNNDSRIWGEIDEIFSQWDKPGSPGCALGIFDDGTIIYEKGYGTADLDHDIPITPESVFYIGSVSKQFAAAAIAILVERGDVQLNDDIREYIPEMPEYETPVRVKHLIHHTSGIRDLYALLNFAEIDVANVISLDEKLDLISSQSDLNFKPGDEYLYSNSGYTLITVLVKRITGKTLREFTHENIFKPLKMESTHFHDNRHEVIENRVLSYQPNDDGTFNLSYLFNFEGVGPGGLYTTIADLFRWDQNLYNNQFTHSPNLNETLHTRGVLNNGDTLHYAFALQFGDYKGLKTVGHSGSFMGFRADYLRFPYENFSVALLCNLGSINPRKLSYQVADILLADKIENYLSEYAGKYTNTDLDVSYRIEVHRSQLKLKRTIPPKNELTYESPDVFSIGGWSIEFQRDDRDEITGFSVDSGRARNVTFHRE